MKLMNLSYIAEYLGALPRELHEALVALPRELQRLVDTARSIERALLHPEDRTKHLVTVQLSRFDGYKNSAGNPTGVWRYAAQSRRLLLDVSETRGMGARSEFRFEALEPDTDYDFCLHAPVGFLVADIRVGTQSRFVASSGGIRLGKVNTGQPGQVVVFIVECF
jgi:hypothetical protein